MSFRATVLLLLMAGVLGSALGVVYAKHESRQLLAQLQQLQNQRDEMDADWSRLQIEQSTLATHLRTETLARDHLRMAIPDPHAVVIVTP